VHLKVETLPIYGMFGSRVELELKSFEVPAPFKVLLGNFRVENLQLAIDLNN